MLLTEAKFIVIDTETTGFDPEKDRVVQLGAVWLDAKGNRLGTFETLVNPEGVPIPADASAIHHIVDADVKDAPTFREAMQMLDKACGSCYNAIAAHNAPFDMAFIKPPSHYPVWDTLRVARKLWPELIMHKNQFLRYHFKLVVPGAQGQMAHSALPDALVTAATLRYQIDSLIARAQERGNDPNSITVETVTEWAAKPIDLRALPIKFGKHKGKTWEEISRLDRGYLQWMVGPKGMTDMDPDQKHTIGLLLA